MKKKKISKQNFCTTRVQSAQSGQYRTRAASLNYALKTICIVVCVQLLISQIFFFYFTLRQILKQLCDCTAHAERKRRVWFIIIAYFHIYLCVYVCVCVCEYFMRVVSHIYRIKYYLFKVKKIIKNKYLVVHLCKDSVCALVATAKLDDLIVGFFL